MPIIKLDEATPAQLRYYARNILNLDVANTENGNTLRAKVLAANPALTEFDIPEIANAPAQAAKPVPSASPAPAKAVIPSGRAGQHFARDPRVELTIARSNDTTRPKDVQLSVNGDVVLIKRGEKVSIPYRHFLALDEAIETVAVDADEINPVTGLPFKLWVEQHSYPFQTHSMPSEADINAWQKRTASIEMA